MKKYFTKYVPVEGEIREGDKCICLFGNSAHKFWTKLNNPVLDVNIVQELKATPNKLKFSNVYPEQEWYANDFQKVELFLFSREINIGDQVYYFSRTAAWDEPKTVGGFLREGGAAWHEEGWIKDEKTPLKGVHGRNWGKKIGKISSNATFATEGMELDEEEVRYYLWNNLTGSGSYVDYSVWSKNKLEQLKQSIQIQCPYCKTFH